MKNLLRSAWSSGIILLLTISGPASTALYSYQAINLDTELFGAPARAQQEEGADNFAVAAVPAVSVEVLTVTAPDGTSELRGSFNAVNYDAVAANDLRYKISLIDRKPVQVENTLSAETYNVYDEIISDESFSIAGDSAKPISFSYTPPAVPSGEYRIRVRIITSHDDQLGWGDTTVVLTTANARFAKLIPLAVSLDQEPAGLDLAQPDGYEPLHGVTVNAGTNITLNYQATNIGEQPLTATPRLIIRAWGAQGEVMATHDADPLTLAAGLSRQGALTFIPPAEPTAYRLDLALFDASGQRVSTLGEYRIVVAGTSGRILSARLEQANSQELTIAAEVVGPADRVSEVEAAITASLIDNGVTITSVTTDSVTLGAKGSKTVVFTLPFTDGLAEPAITIALVSSDGETLDTYTFLLDTNSLLTDSGSAAGLKNTSTTLLIVLVSIIVIIVLVLAVLIHRARVKKTIPPTSGTMLLLVALGVTAVITQNVQAQGPGGKYYYRSNPNSVVRVFINRPIHNNDTNNPDQVYLDGKIPVEAEVTYNHCANRTSFGGLAIDYIKAGGHTIPTTADWVPFHSLFPAGLVEGAINIPASYTGKATDADKYTVLTYTEEIHQRFTPDGPRHNTHSGTIAVDPLLKDMTLRITGYAGQWTGARSERPIHGWFGAYTHLTLGETPTPPPVPVDPPTPPTAVAPTADFTVPSYAYVGNKVEAISTSSTGTNALWQNQDNPLDVNGNNALDPRDSLLITNYLLAAGSHTLPTHLPPAYVDVNGDGSVNSDDKQVIIDYLNAKTSGGNPTTSVGNETPWQNQANPLDVNGDGFVSSGDVNAINRHLNSGSASTLPKPPQPYIDVNGDGQISQADKDIVQNALDGVRTDTPACCKLQYRWQITNVTTDTDITPTANTGSRISTVPATPATLLFRLTVTNDAGLSGTAERMVQILPAATLPTCPAPYFDVNGDDIIDSKDSTAVTNYLDGSKLSPQPIGAKWQNQFSPLDVNNDKSISPIDSLQISNYLNAGGSPNLPTLPPECSATVIRQSPPTCPAPYLDVNGDGWITANDTLIVANHLAGNTEAVATNEAAAWQNQTNPLDVNGDGTLSPIDNLQIINYINGGHKPNIGVHACVPPTQSRPARATCPAPFYDVTGDGYVSPIDLQKVVNYLLYGNTDVISIIESAAWQNATNPRDVSGDGAVSPIDMLQISNYLNADHPSALPDSSSCATQDTPTQPQALPVCPAPVYYLDVDGNDVLNDADNALLVNHLNAKEIGLNPAPPAGNNAPWQNQTNALDVNNDGAVNTRDSLRLGTYYRPGQTTSLPQPDATCSASGPGQPQETFNPGIIREVE